MTSAQCSMQVKVSVLVVSFNTRELTIASLHALMSSELDTSWEVIVVDNASGDGSVSAIRERFGERVNVIDAGENLGFAAANNLAAERAAGEYLLLLNPDTEVEPSAVANLLDFAGRWPRAGIWGGRTFYGDGSVNPTFCWGRQTLWSLTVQALGLSSTLRGWRWGNPEGAGRWIGEREVSVDIVSGCFLLISRSLWECLGGFRTRYFMYGEEADLCLRAYQWGFRAAITPCASLVHHGGASERVPADKLVRLLTAKARLIQDHMPATARYLGGYLLLAWPLTRMLAHGALAAGGRAASAERASVWKEVWRRRAEWWTVPLRGRTGEA